MTDENIEIQEEEEEDQTPSLKKRLNIYKTALIVVAIAAASSWIMSFGDDKKPVIPAPVVQEKIVEVDPEVERLVMFQKRNNPKLPIEIAEIQAKLLIARAKSEDIPLEILVGIAKAESNFNPTRTSEADAAGLMQILRGETEIDQDRKYDLDYNITMGCTILKEKLEKNDGNLTKALAAYSGGAKWYVEKIYEGFVSYKMFQYGKKVTIPDKEIIKATPKEVKNAKNEK